MEKDTLCSYEWFLYEAQCIVVYMWNKSRFFLMIFTFLYFRYFCSICSSISWKENKRECVKNLFGVSIEIEQLYKAPSPDSTLYSCVPGDSVLIFEPNWTNISVIAPIRSWRALYSSYSAQKSFLYCWRCSSAVMVLYFLKRKNVSSY